MMLAETLRRIEPMRTFQDGRQLATHKTPEGQWYVYERKTEHPQAWKTCRGPFSNGRAAARWIRGTA